MSFFVLIFYLSIKRSLKCLNNFVQMILISNNLYLFHITHPLQNKCTDIFILKLYPYLLQIIIPKFIWLL